MNFNYLTRVACFCVITALSISACSNNTQHLAPVSDGWADAKAASKNYRVQSDDTLYSIAFRFGLDYRELAAANNIEQPYHIYVGQRLNLTSGAIDATAAEMQEEPLSMPVARERPIEAPGVNYSNLQQQRLPSAQSVVPASPASRALPTKSILISEKDITADTGKWRWPTHGKIIHLFSTAYGQTKGVDIAGTLNQPVQATSAGKVVYCGNGLRGYGLLIIIKHNTEYLSAYAHNNKALVHEGDSVKAGQVIALMGNSEAPQTMLHFEIRRGGKPVDPLHYLLPR